MGKGNYLGGSTIITHNGWGSYDPAEDRPAIIKTETPKPKAARKAKSKKTNRRRTQATKAKKLSARAKWWQGLDRDERANLQKMTACFRGDIHPNQVHQLGLKAVWKAAKTWWDRMDQDGQIRMKKRFAHRGKSPILEAFMRSHSGQKGM